MTVITDSEGWVIDIIFHNQEVHMRIKPFTSINFCYKCGCPVPRVGISIKTGMGNISTTTPFICPKCKSKKKKR